MARRQRQAKPLSRTVAGMKRAMRAAEPYTGASVSNLTHSWGTSPIPVNEVIRRTLTALRARSREQRRNNDYARKFIGMLKSNVAGPTGAAFNARTIDANGKPDKAANQALEETFADWSKKINCDVEGRQSFAGLQQLHIATAGEDGECLVRIYRGRSFGPYGFQLQFIDPELLPVHYNEDLKNGNIIRMGIEYDSLGRAQAYHLLDTSSSGDFMGQYFYGHGDYIRVPASDIIHSYLTESAGQARGLPWMSTALFRMNMLGGYEEAALVNARAGANKMGFYRTGDLGGVADEDPQTGELIDEGEPGHWSKLPPGIEIQEYDPTYPHQQFPDFVKTALRGISAGLGCGYHTLANDLEGVNYSSGRLGMFDERDYWQVLQGWQSEDFMMTVYNEWLKHQLLIGTIRVKSRPLNPSRILKYQRVEFMGRRWFGLDPVKESKANTEDLGNNLTAPSDIIRSKGLDPQEVFQQIADDKATFKELGIEVVVKEPAAAPAAPDEEVDEEEGKEAT